MEVGLSLESEIFFNLSMLLLDKKKIQNIPCKITWSKLKFLSGMKMLISPFDRFSLVLFSISWLEIEFLEDLFDLLMTKSINIFSKMLHFLLKWWTLSLFVAPCSAVSSMLFSMIISGPSLKMFSLFVSKTSQLINKEWRNNIFSSEEWGLFQ